MPIETRFVSLINGATSLTILLREYNLKEDRILKVHFDNPLMYRVIDEAQQLVPDDNAIANFNYSYDSELLIWFHEQSAGIHEDATLIYYMICTLDNIIEVITAVEGKVVWEY